MDLCQLLPTQFSKNINLSSKRIVTIGKLQSNSPFLQIENLHLSHNNLNILDGIEQFKILKSLSISNNQISDINELKKVNKNLQYLTLHSNPFTVYDYNDVCYNLFPKLRRLDGMAVDTQQIKQQRINAEKVSRWFIPWLMNIKQQIENIQKVLQLRGTVKEINQNSQLKVIENDLLMQVNWQQIDSMLLFLNQQNLSNLSKQVQLHTYSQELDAAQTKEMKKLHYDTFLDLIKLQSSNHYTAFIDYLLRLSDGDQSNYYKVFLKIQKPQLHISQDLYSKDDDTFIEMEPQKIKQQVPTFLQDKIKCQDIISNTYRKERIIPNYEKEHFYQYLPVFPFRQEYIQSIIQIGVLKLNELKNLVSQIAYLKQSPMSSIPQSVRTLRRKQKNNGQPAPEKLSLRPSKLEISPREDKQLPEKPTVRHYNEVKSEIIRAQNANKLENVLMKVINRRMRRYFSRINNKDQENTRFFDFPELVYLQSIWEGMKRVLDKSRIRRQKLMNKRLLILAFQGLKLQRQFKKRELKRVNKGYQILQKIYFKRLVDGIRSMRSLIQPIWKVKHIQPFKLQLKQVPNFEHHKNCQIKFRNYDENVVNQKICSVCNYDFSKLREQQ